MSTSERASAARHLRTAPERNGVSVSGKARSRGLCGQRERARLTPQYAPATPGYARLTDEDPACRPTQGARPDELAAAAQRRASGHIRPLHLTVPVSGVGGGEQALPGQERSRDGTRGSRADEESDRQKAEPRKMGLFTHAAPGTCPHDPPLNRDVYTVHMPTGGQRGGVAKGSGRQTPSLRSSSPSWSPTPSCDQRRLTSALRRHSAGARDSPSRSSSNWTSCSGCSDSLPMRASPGSDASSRT